MVGQGGGTQAGRQLHPRLHERGDAHVRARAEALENATYVGADAASRRPVRERVAVDEEFGQGAAGPRIWPRVARLLPGRTSRTQRRRWLRMRIAVFAPRPAEPQPTG